MQEFQRNHTYIWTFTRSFNELREIDLNQEIGFPLGKRLLLDQANMFNEQKQFYVTNSSIVHTNILFQSEKNPFGWKDFTNSSFQKWIEGGL